MNELTVESSLEDLVIEGGIGRFSSMDDDDDEDEVRAIAASLAPAIQEFEELLSSTAVGVDGLPFSPSSGNQTPKMKKTDPGDEDDDDDDEDSDVNWDDDDSMDQELNRLAASEQLLRQELEFAHDFGSMLSPSEKENSSQSFFDATQKVQPKPDAILEENSAHLDHLTGGGTSTPQSSLLDNDSSHTDSTEEMPPDKSPISSNDGRTNVGPKSPDGSPEKPVTRHSYTLSDHSHYLKIQTESRGGWYHVPLTAIDLREYVIPLPERELQRLYVGLLGEDPLGVRVSQAPQAMAAFEQLPLRVITMKIRPDVLVGAVMDGLVSSLDEHMEIIKRQGGHLVLQNPGIKLDFQMCTYKGTGGRFCERILLLRIFYSESSNNTNSAPAPTLEEGTSMVKANLKLKEAAALVQKLETTKRGAQSEGFFANSFFSKQPMYPNKRAMQRAIAEQLLQKFKACPGVKEGNLTLPALSRDDWPWIQYSWKFVRLAWEELQDRDLTYSTLQTSVFGKFPNLPTLDTHYCSQLRRLCRENMIISLLKSASELEQYAREAEYTCANLIQVLRPSFEAYQVVAPNLPHPMPLTAYPLDFTTHQSICPPWGQKVMEALNQVAASDATQETSFSEAERAVQLVLDALQRQDDEEQSARLGRKNAQVMDRLAKMQAHKRASIEALQKAYSTSPKAKKAAQEFHSLACKGNCEVPEEEQVPLFKCSILVGSSTGSCYVSSTQILCVTQLIPVIGGNTVTLFDFKGLEFVVQDASPSLLNPLPAGISIKREGETVYSFRPSYGAARLKAFLEIIQAVGSAEPHKASSSTSNNTDRGVLYMYGDHSPQKLRHTSGA